MTKIAILYPSDPAGNAPSGIDSVIRGILKWAPPDLEYTLLGATTDPVNRPVGVEVDVKLGEREVRFLPLVAMDARAGRGRVPVVVRYMRALYRYAGRGGLSAFDIFDFHRVEPVWLFRKDPRPKNVIVHQDMSIIRDKGCDIGWRHAPWVYELVEHALFSKVNHIFSVRQSAVLRYQKIYPDLSDRFSFIPTWVDASTFYPPMGADGRTASRAELRATLGLTRQDTRVLSYVGRLDKQKDPLLLLNGFHEALGRLGNLHLAIIGDGVLRQAAEAACQALNISQHVSFVGVQPPQKIAAALRGSDLFLLASAYEGMPVAVLEALATGLPVVSTSVGEIPLFVRNGVNGGIISNRTPSAMADAIAAALERLEWMTGEPCTASVADYQPEKVLHLLFDNHRRQTANQAPR
jgi:glycosyltransferase involved in cell wall biosynthesis